MRNNETDWEINPWHTRFGQMKCALKLVPGGMAAVILKASAEKNFRK